MSCDNNTYSCLDGAYSNRRGSLLYNKNYPCGPVQPHHPVSPTQYGCINGSCTLLKGHYSGPKFNSRNQCMQHCSATGR